MNSILISDFNNQKKKHKREKTLYKQANPVGVPSQGAATPFRQFVMSKIMIYIWEFQE